MITGKTTILVVEDEALVRMAIAISLEDAGFAVLEASNYDGAMVMLTHNPSIAAMFTDVDMLPGHSGIELAKVVRRLWPVIKILVTSGHRHIHDEALPVAGRFLDKPYDAARVITSLREMMLAA
jgi:DNA-binding NtrC family response regulator